MKERTLYHLLIVVGNHLARDCENETIKSQIRSALDSLAVSKERQKPYVISFDTGRGPESLTCDANLFSFHSRGDLEVRVRSRSETLDLSMSNRAQAVALWTLMIPQISQLRPPDKETSQLSRVAKRAKPLYLAILAIGVSLTTAKMPEFAVTALLLLATTIGSPFLARFSVTSLSVVLPMLFVVLYSDYSLSSLTAFLILVTVIQIPGLLLHRLGAFLIAALVGALATTFPGAIAALLLAIVFEVVSAVSTQSLSNRGGLFVALGFIVAAQFWNPMPTPLVDAGDVGVITCSVILTFAFTPTLTHQSLVRIWAPLGIAVIHIFSNISYAYGLCILALWCTVALLKEKIQLKSNARHQMMGGPLHMSQRNR